MGAPGGWLRATPEGIYPGTIQNTNFTINNLTPTFLWKAVPTNGLINYTLYLEKRNGNCWQNVTSVNGQTIPHFSNGFTNNQAGFNLNAFNIQLLAGEEYRWRLVNNYIAGSVSSEHQYFKIAAGTTATINEQPAMDGLDGGTAIIEINHNDLRVELSPNPANNLLTLKLTNESDISGNASIVNSMGETLEVFRLSNLKNYKIDISNLITGLYTLVLRTNFGVETKMFQIVH